MMTMIDQVANQNHLQLIKAMLPYLPPEKCVIVFLTWKQMLA